MFKIAQQKPCIYSGKKKTIAYKSDISRALLHTNRLSDYLQMLHQYLLVEEVKYLL